MTRLPEGFEGLTPFVDDWAVETSAERAARRDTSTPEAREAFYAAVRELLEPALAYLDTKPLPAHDMRDRTLMQLVLSLAHVALAVETQQQDEPRHRVHRRELRITRTPADVRG